MQETQGIDKNLAAEIREEIDREAPELANYFMTAEIRRITRFSYSRINYALRKHKKHPLHGVKRGDRWFVNMLDVLEWAEGVSREQQARWTSNAERLARLAHRTKKQMGIPAGAPPPPVTNRVPEGRRVYTVEEAATVTGFQHTTLKTTLSRNGPLAHVERWNVGQTKRYDADQIDAYVQQRQQERDLREQAMRDRETEKRERARQLTPPKSQIPDGQRVYDIIGVAITLKTTNLTAYTYLSGNGPLAHIGRWRGPHNRKYYDADAVDAFARDSRHFDRNPANRKYDTPNVTDINDHRVA